LSEFVLEVGPMYMDASA